MCSGYAYQEGIPGFDCGALGFGASLFLLSLVFGILSCSPKMKHPRPKLSCHCEGSRSLRFRCVKLCNPGARWIRTPAFRNCNMNDT